MACDYLAIYNALLIGVAIAAGPLWNAFHMSNCYSDSGYSDSADPRFLDALLHSLVRMVASALRCQF